MISNGIVARNCLKIFSYVVARDYGFAPNPFFSVCTLATCKPIVRRMASIGDWVIGTGSSEIGRKGYLVYAMRITEIMSFSEYWTDKRFRRKRPNLRGSKKQAFGDNIYFRSGHGIWQQLDSHHSYTGGRSNPHNIKHDTQTDRVLLSDDFAYWGGLGPTIPKRFRDYDGQDICAQRGYKNKFPRSMRKEFAAWSHSLGEKGFLGPPTDWARAR